ncbi:unnamed protein product [Ixodes hexagonus]
MYVLNFLDSYLGGVLLGLVAVAEALSMALVYGVDRFALDCEFMLESPPGILIKICWKFLCPVALCVIFGAGFFSYEQLKFGDYVYPTWISVLAFVLVASAIQAVPTCAFSHFMQCGYSCSKALKPLDMWGPKDPTLRKKYDEFMAARGYGPQGGGGEEPPLAVVEKPPAPVEEVQVVAPLVMP